METSLSRTAARDARAEDVPVVIVEDDPDACEALKALVELDGYRVHTASSVAQAKAVIAEQSPLCVILDLGLPDASGIDLAHSLRRTQDHTLVVIAVTGSVEPEDAIAAEAAGVDYLLHKPLDIERFRRILQPLH